MKPVLEGIMPALITPYHADGALNVDVIRRLVAFQLEQGCHGFFVCGSTGEGLLLTSEERAVVARTVIETVAGQVPVIVHVGAMTTREAAWLASDARKAGATAVASLPPIYYRVALPGIREHIAAIAHAAELPTFYYHIPQLTGYDLSAQQVAELLTSIEGVVGLKFTHHDLYLMGSILAASGDQLRVFCGGDPVLFHGLCVGACGGIGSTYNYQLRTMVGIYDAMKRGDYEAGRSLQAKANRVIGALFKNGGNLACEKAIMRLLGFDVGLPRAPLVPFPDDRMPDLRRDLEEAGLFD